MARDTLELADDSLFIANINHAFTAADACPPAGAHGFSKDSASGFDLTPFQAANLLIDHDAEAITIAGALLVPLIWKDLACPGKVQKHFDWKSTVALKNLSFPVILRIDNLNFIYAT